MNFVLAALASVLVVGAARPARVTIADFHITVDATTAGWEMHCQKGCKWTELSLTCKPGCRALVDEIGVTRSVSAKPRATDFAFVIERTPEGWSAKSVSGTAWLDLSWGCRLVTCRAHLDASGVSGP